MLRTFKSLLLIGVLANLFCVPTQAQEQPWVQTVKEMKQVVHKAIDNDKSVKVKLKERRSGQTTLTGRVSEASDAGFILSDEKTNRASTLRYDELKEVKVKGWSTGSKIAVGAVVAAAVIVLAVIYKIASSD